MNPRLLLHSLLVLIALAAPSKAWAQAASQPPRLKLKVMTYNLRYASARPPNAWPDRRPIMRRAIEGVGPDLFGTQEGLYEQLKELASDLPAYEWIGLGREGGSRGEFMAVFYRKERLEPIAYDHFWLSDTPEVIGSSTWGHSNRRMVTWVRFRERSSSREFFFWNTHLDHEVETARQKAAGLIRDRISTVATNLPLILVGDFNCAAGSRAYEILTKEGGLTDAWALASRREHEQLNTFNGFQPAVEGGVRIDWILFRGQAEVGPARIVNYAENGQFPSDHFPVVTSLTFP